MQESLDGDSWRSNSRATSMTRRVITTSPDMIICGKKPIQSTISKSALCGSFPRQSHLSGHLFGLVNIPAFKYRRKTTHLHIQERQAWYSSAGDVPRGSQMRTLNVAPLTTSSPSCTKLKYSARQKYASVSS